ncbi:hypothetical protein HPB51_022180 [Rhipicephalus microplus]|uniref:Uncharacterized protein n=1 Tax=Rhipicephalus microplus TaxID=6941 RepID=A0A9J6F8H1_RHIMP|nr:hypothetical protein HPB51_022180 [Rhipicephalus microplus]
MSRTLQLIRGATLPPCQYMCAQPPITQVYTSLPPAPPPLHRPPMVPPPCMEPNIRLEHRWHRRAPPLWAFRPQPPPHEKEMIITEEIPQTSPCPHDGRQQGDDEHIVCNCHRFRIPPATATGAAGTAAENLRYLSWYHSSKGLRHSSTCLPRLFHRKQTAVVEQPDEALVCVTATPATSARRSDSTPCPTIVNIYRNTSQQHGAKCRCCPICRELAEERQFKL